jgi:hypothetical protein
MYDMRQLGSHEIQFYFSLSVPTLTLMGWRTIKVLERSIRLQNMWDKPLLKSNEIKKYIKYSVSAWLIWSECIYDMP